MFDNGKTFTVQLRDGSQFNVAGNGQLFTFRPIDRSEDLIFCIVKLIEMQKQDPSKWETIEIDLIPEHARMIDETRGIEHHHLRRMPKERMEEPGIGVFLEDDSFLLVDGNHRYLKRINTGLRTMRFHTCRPPTWRASLIDLAATQRAWEGQR